MDLERLSQIKDLLHPQKKEEPTEVSKVEILKIRRELRQKTEDLHNRLMLVSKILNDKKFNNKLDLGTNPKKINWDEMPKEIADCFRPEFGYQADEITSFAISSKREESNGEISLQIGLNRNNQWWSYIGAGAIVRQGYTSGTEYIGCQAKLAQPKKAREAMEALDKSLWEKGRKGENDPLTQERHGLNSLELAESLLQFTASELEKRFKSTNS